MKAALSTEAVDKVMEKHPARAGEALFAATN